jgi:hypothetical protein
MRRVKISSETKGREARSQRGEERGGFLQVTIRAATTVHSYSNIFATDLS